MAIRCIIGRSYPSEIKRALRHEALTLNTARPLESRVKVAKEDKEGKCLLSPVSVNTHLSRARGVLRDRSERTVEEQRAEAAATYEGVIRDPLALPRDRVRAQKALEELQGLKKSPQIDLEDLDPPTGFTITVVDNRGLAAVPLEDEEDEEAIA